MIENDERVIARWFAKANVEHPAMAWLVERARTTRAR